MDNGQLVSDFGHLPPQTQITVLVRLAHELTIVARDTYEPSSLNVRHPARLRALNEAQHRVTSHLRALLAGDSHRYPDDVLVSVILDGDDPDVARQIAGAFARSMRNVASGVS